MRRNKRRAGRVEHLVRQPRVGLGDGPRHRECADVGSTIYVMIARYADDAALLAGVRPAHHAYARRLRQAGGLLMGGPLTDGSGAIFVYRAASPDALDEMIADDPFHRCGVFAGTDIKAWTPIAIDLAGLDRLASRLPDDQKT